MGGLSICPNSCSDASGYSSRSSAVSRNPFASPRNPILHSIYLISSICFAGKLIQDAGLKGYRSGDVMVSEKHSGFVVNVGKGTCGDAMRVIEHVQRTVYEQFGVELELEVKRV